MDLFVIKNEIINKIILKITKTKQKPQRIVSLPYGGFRRLPVSLFIILFLFTACKKSTPPQLPSNKGITVDSTSLKLLKMNEMMAVQEDSILNEYVRTNNLDFRKDKLGFWYKIEPKTKGKKITENSLVNLRYQLLSLDNKVLVDEVILAQLGKKNLTVGFESGLLLMREDESATLIVPWYLAFGLKGNGAEVSPYTSVIYKIKVLAVK